MYAREPVNQEILALVEQHPGTYQRELTDLYGKLPRSTMAHRFHKMADLGILEKSIGNGRETRYWKRCECR